MVLKAVSPEVIEPSKPKFMISGRSGVGKSYFALSFPSPYFVDTEGGAVRRQYREKLVASGGAYFGKEQGSQDFATVIEEIKALATTKHNYKTLVIDSFSYLYNAAAAIAEERMGNEFGRDKKEANRPTRQLMRWLENLDMTTILVCHHRDKWERKGKEIINAGSSFDGFDKLEYILDLWIECQKIGQARTFIVRKSRIESFVDGKELPLDYAIFSDLYGREVIEKVSVPVEVASEDQVKEVLGLMTFVKIEEDMVRKWFEKEKVESWAEMTKVQIQKYIDAIRKKFEPALKGGK